MTWPPRISPAWSDPTHLVIAAVISFIGFGGAIGAYEALKRESDRSCPPPCTLETEKPPSHAEVEKTVNWPLYGYDDQRTRYLPTKRVRPPLRRLRVELSGRQAARVLADRRQRDPLLPGQERRCCTRSAPTRATSNGRSRSARSAQPPPPTPTASCSRSPSSVRRESRRAKRSRFAPRTASCFGDSRSPGAARRRRWWSDSGSSSAASPVTSTRSIARRDTSLARARPQGRSRAAWPIDQGVLFDGNYAGQVFAIDASNGQFVWQSSTQGLSFGRGGSVYSTPAVAFGRVYLGSIDNRVYSFDRGHRRAALEPLDRRLGLRSAGGRRHAALRTDRLRRLEGPELLRARREDRRGALA